MRERCSVGVFKSVHQRGIVRQQDIPAGFRAPRESPLQTCEASMRSGPHQAVSWADSGLAQPLKDQVRQVRQGFFDL